MPRAKKTVTVRIRDGRWFTHEATTFTVDDGGYLHLNSATTGTVAVYAPGAWDSATKAVGTTNSQPAGEDPTDQL